MGSLTVSELAKKLGAEIAVGEGLDAAVRGGYVCDLLSFVIGKARGGDVWITVIGNVNTIAVASLTDVCCILLAEDTPLDDDAREKALMIGLPVLRSAKSSYALAVELGRLLGQP